jgi:hypothetical protein
MGPALQVVLEQLHILNAGQKQLKKDVSLSQDKLDACQEELEKNISTS